MLHTSMPILGDGRHSLEGATDPPSRIVNTPRRLLTTTSTWSRPPRTPTPRTKNLECQSPKAKQPVGEVAEAPGAR
jgi:hypothetical protein